MHDPVPDRRAARAAGQHRVQTVTIWTAAGSVLAATLLSAVLANGTAAARQTSGNRLQPPDNVPGIINYGGGGPIIGSGGS